MVNETYRAEVYDDGKYGKNFRLQRSGKGRGGHIAPTEFRLAANDDPAELVPIVRQILQRGGEIVFPSTDEIRKSYPPDSFSATQIECMRAFTAREKNLLLAA